MKNQVRILVLTIILIAITTIGLTVKAAGATANLVSSKSEAERGETFTVTLSTSCEEGINGLEGKLSYDETKLEFVSAVVVDTSKWYNFGDTTNFAIIHNANDTIKTANIIRATFKVKSTAEIGTTAKVTVSNIKVDSDAATNSLTTIGTKEVEISIIERLAINLNGYTEKIQSENRYMSKISHRTTLQNLVSKVQTNGTIEVFRGTTKVTDTGTKLATGMKIKITLRDESIEYKAVVTGDSNGDGEVDFSDILQINKHRLGKATLTGEYLEAGDVTGEGTADFSDILQINKYRLGKISSL